MYLTCLPSKATSPQRTSNPKKHNPKKLSVNLKTKVHLFPGFFKSPKISKRGRNHLNRNIRNNQNVHKSMEIPSEESKLNITVGVENFKKVRRRLRSVLSTCDDTLRAFPQEMTDVTHHMRMQKLRMDKYHQT